jgi:hypothetical protein
MKPSTEKLLIAGILVSGVIAFWAHAASASGGGSASPPPSDFHPELSADERRFVWDEVQNNTGAEMQSKASVYASTIMPDGSHLSPAALAALSAEATWKLVLPGGVRL